MPPRTRSSARGETSTAATEASPREPSVAPPSSEHVAATSDDESEVELAKPATRKRARKERQNSAQEHQPPVKRVRGNKGKLRGLMNMPIDVFIEISKYLYPLDLILLARANKFFRRMLMSRSAIQTWQYALSNVPGLPPCPKELCEPQYAALVFSKYCSVCGNQALRPMDPMLQVRLCPSCRGSQLTRASYAEELFVNHSYTIIPGKSGRGRWCLIRDLEIVQTKLGELGREHDTTAIRTWERKKMNEVEERRKNALPLVEFLKKMENEQKDDLAQRKGGREDEIHIRLLNLGWTEGDFRMYEAQAVKKWNILVCVAKPLTERNWETILPTLTELLEHNRKLRLKAEAATRQQRRNSYLYEWIESYFKQLPPYVRVADGSSPAAGEPLDSAPTSAGSVQPTNEPGGANNADRTSPWPTPSMSLVFTWAPFQLLLDTDKPHEEFKEALEQIRPDFMELLLEWRTKTEETIANNLSSQIPSSSTTEVLEVTATSTSNIIPELNILVDSRPILSLPMDIQRIFRADTVLTRYSAIEFYPDDSQRRAEYDIASWHYHEEASNIARVLLNALGRPNATYLEMKAMGESFACGRCCTRNCVTWKQLITHFRDEKLKAERFQKIDLVANGTITFVFTHDTQTTEHDRPLVKLANEEDKQTPYGKHAIPRHFQCVTCISLYRYESYSKAAAVEHLRQVHLVQNPEEGKDYR